VKNIKAVIYDVDGTLVNSEPLHVAAWDSALKQYSSGLNELSKAFVRTMAGKKPVIIAAEMTGVLNIDASADDLLKLKTAIYLKLAREQLMPMSGAIESVKALMAAGYRLAIGTSLDASLLDAILRHLNILDDFEVKVTGDQINKGKPDPETYLKVIELLQLLPEECIVLEDAQTGIRSAKAADAWCIAVENEVAIKQDISEADAVVTSLLEVTPDFIKNI
jgi:HAD superfamily hydrolase (TIGR01509 family)